MNPSNSIGAQPQNRQYYGPTLADVFEFTAEDLAANRTGTVTDHQRGQLKVDGKNYRKTMVLAIGAIFIFAILTIMFLPRGEPVRQMIATQPALAAAVLGIIAVGYLVFLAVTFIGTSSAGKGNIKVTVVNGSFKLVGRPVTSLDGKVYQRIKIGRLNSYVTDAQASALVPGSTYRAYLKGNGQTAKILSIETA